MESLELIDISLIAEVTVNIEKYIDKYKSWIDASKLLNKEGIRYTSEGNFESDTWMFFQNYEQHFFVLDFSKFKNLLYSESISKDEISLVKCFIVDVLMNGSATRSTVTIFNSILRIIELTNNFDMDIVKGRKGDTIRTFVKEVSNGKKQGIGYVIQYIEFLDDINLANDCHTKVLSSLASIGKLKDRVVRQLPENKDILAFNYYLKKFYNEENDEILKSLFMPVLMWWKITNIIPMRPSEFANKLKRDCIRCENSRYYLYINRIKVTKTNPTIPLLSRVEITKEIFNLIEYYKEITSFDTESLTLISYKAYIKYNKAYMSKYKPEFISTLNESNNKKYTKMFTRGTLSRILKSFYRVIIKGIYEDNSITKELKIGDTRHLAFCSLMLQGVSPIEIAMLGGHTTLEAQCHYMGHADYYIESEIINYIGNNDVCKIISSKGLKGIIFNMPLTPHRSIGECIATEEGVGYCTLNLEEDISLCDNVLQCVYCSKWWCEPTNENFVKIRLFLENNVMASIQRSIQIEEQFLRKLLLQAKVVNISGLLEVDKCTDEKIRQTALNIKSSADRIVFYKTSLIEAFDSTKTKIHEGSICNGKAKERSK